MTRATPKYGAPAGYWIPGFTLDKDTRQIIARYIGKRLPQSFYKRLEEETARFIAWDKFKKTMPTPADVKAALKETERDVRRLLAKLYESKGLDFQARHKIAVAWALHGESGHVVDDCEKPLQNLWAAILLAQRSMEGKIPKGRPVEANRGFASRIYDIFVKFKLEPTAAWDGQYTAVLSILFNAASINTGEDNIRRLAETAAKLHRFNRA